MVPSLRIGQQMRWDDGKSGDIVMLIDGDGTEIAESEGPVTAIVKMHEALPGGQFAVFDLRDGDYHFELDVRQ